jgi:hypothetical protein
MSAFESIIYTDCRPDEGLSGVAGLQFQARSPGADQSALRLVENRLLYEPPALWTQQRRPVDDYPVSFAHDHDGWFATAAGRYLGKEIDGNREGNHLTHAVATRDPRAYRLVRPAQLFQAGFWTTAPAPRSECPPLAGPLAPGPFGPVEAQEFVTKSAERRAMLVHLLSAVECLTQPQPRRIAFIATDPVAVLQWLIAATLLVPQDVALRLGFKVFVTNPLYTSQPIIAVHPGFGPVPMSVRDDRGFVVFDLVGDDYTRLRPSENAGEWVERFCQGDPYDVMDMIESAAASGLTGRDARLIGVATKAAEKLSDDQAIVLVDWLYQYPDRLTPYRDRLIHHLTASIGRWSHPVLLRLDDFGRNDQLPPGMAPAVRLALIGTEASTARTDATVPAGRRPQVPGWDPEHTTEAVRILTLALESGPPPPAFDAVLRLATRFGLDPDLTTIGAATATFVHLWASRPELNFDQAAWPTGVAQLISSALRRTLTERADSADRNLVGDEWWRRYADGLTEIRDALDEIVLATMVDRRTGPDRDQLVRDWLHRAGADPAYYAHVVGALFERAHPFADELDLVIAQAPGPVPIPGHVFAELREWLLDRRSLPLELRALTRRLITAGLLRADAPMQDLLDQDARAQAATEALAAYSDPADFSSIVDNLNDVSRRVLAPYLRALVEGAIQLTRLGDLDRLLTAAPALLDPYLVQLRAQLLNDPPVELAVVAFYLCHSPRVNEPARKELLLRVRSWIYQHPRKIRRFEHSLAEQHPEVFRRWSAWYPKVAIKRRWWNPLDRMNRAHGHG